MATSIYTIQFKQPFDTTEGDITSTAFQMLIGMQVPTGDPEPANPTFSGCTYVSSSIDRSSYSADITDTYIKVYSFNSEWEPNMVRILDAELGDYEVPDNEASFEVKTARDTHQGYTTVVYFTAEVATPTP